MAGAAFNVSFPARKTVGQVSFPSGASSRGSHQLLAAASCERKYAFRHVFGLKIVHEPPWRAIGSAVHEALAWHYAALLPPEKRPAVWSVDNLEDLVMQASRGVPETFQNAMDVYRYYVHHFSADPWKPVEVEKEFSATLGELDPDGRTGEQEDDEVVTCRSDLIVESNGSVFVVDHKCTAGNYVTGRLDRWSEHNEYRLSLQAMVNVLLVRLEFARRGDPRSVDGFIIQRIKRKQPYEVDRNLIDIPPPALRDAPGVLRQLVRRELEIRRAVAAGEKVLPNYSQCMSKWGPCDYMSICTAPSDEQRRLAMETEYGV